MLKDLGLAQDAATRTSTATPLGSAALHIYRLMCNSGEFATKDFSSAFQFLSKEDNRYKDYFQANVTTSITMQITFPSHDELNVPMLLQSLLNSHLLTS